MTVPLSAGSPRAIAARRFGLELAKAMRIDTAARLAEVLDWPMLVKIRAAVPEPRQAAHGPHRRRGGGGAVKPVRWVWCLDCEAWIGAEPPRLPPYWSLDKAAAMHRYGAPRHRLRRVLLEELLEGRVPATTA